ncbi:MAG: hypothetical protein AABW67_04225 [Nanoarchaeota archaeon]
MEKKKILLIIGIILLFELILIDYLSFVNIFYPSYVSTRLACSKDFKTNQVVTGIFTPDSNQIEISCNIQIDSLEFKKILAHENVHRKQFYEGRLYNCDGKLNLGVFQNELQAYSNELLV